MNVRNFDPRTVTLSDEITVEHTEHATRLRIPRNIEDFGLEEPDNSLGGQLRRMFDGLLRAS